MTDRRRYSEEAHEEEGRTAAPPWMYVEGSDDAASWEEDANLLVEHGFGRRLPSREQRAREIRKVELKAANMYHRLSRITPWDTKSARCVGFVILCAMLLGFLYIMERLKML